jgi:aspartate/methionine/tyrosine aminotransferase
MLEAPLAPYLLWAKTRHPAAIDLAGSNLLHCTLDDLPGAREAVDLRAANDSGYPPLVEAIAAHAGVGTDRVATAQGCSGANFLAIAGLVGPGDHVLVERPTYDPLLGACRLMGATIERFGRRFETGWRPDLDELRRCIRSRTRLIVLTSPHNPSGTVLDNSTLSSIGALADRVGAHVLVDQVYLDAASFIAQDANLAVPAVRLDGPFVSTSSLTKSYGLAGLRCGWVLAAPAVAERLRRTRDVVDNAGSAPADLLAALAFARLERLRERAAGIVGSNAERVRHFLAEHPQLEVAGPPEAPIIFPRLAGAHDAGTFVQRLLDRHGVAVAPGHFFDSPAHFRVSLAGRSDVLERGLACLADALALVEGARPC